MRTGDSRSCGPRHAPSAVGRCRIGRASVPVWMVRSGVTVAPRMSPGRARTRQRCAGRTRSRGLHEADVAADPFEQFRRWFDDAVAAGLPEPNAMVLATARRTGCPRRGRCCSRAATSAASSFFTNHGSRKGADLAANPRAALVFPWHPLERQVRVMRRGAAGRRRRGRRDYFATRPRESQLGAWASDAVRGDRRSRGARGRVRRGRAAVAGGYGGAGCPPSWGGYRVVPDDGGVLAGPDRAHARPAALPPYRRRLGIGAARALIDDVVRVSQSPFGPTVFVVHRSSDGSEIVGGPR